jgi:hypothetical protein
VTDAKHMLRPVKCVYIATKTAVSIKTSQCMRFCARIQVASVKGLGRSPKHIEARFSAVAMRRLSDVHARTRLLFEPCRHCSRCRKLQKRRLAGAALTSFMKKCEKYAGSRMRDSGSRQEAIRRGKDERHQGVREGHARRLKLFHLRN